MPWCCQFYIDEVANVAYSDEVTETVDVKVVISHKLGTVSIISPSRKSNILNQHRIAPWLCL